MNTGCTESSGATMGVIIYRRCAQSDSYVSCREEELDKELAALGSDRTGATTLKTVESRM
jgi:hypothetical protein